MPGMLVRGEFQMKCRTRGLNNQKICCCFEKRLEPFNNKYAPMVKIAVCTQCEVTAVLIRSIAVGTRLSIDFA